MLSVQQRRRRNPTLALYQLLSFLNTTQFSYVKVGFFRGQQLVAAVAVQPPATSFRFVSVQYFDFYKTFHDRSFKCCNVACVVVIMWSRYRLALFVILNTWILAGQSFILREDESFLENPFYHSQEDIDELFDKLSKHFPHNARVVHVGKSAENRNLIALHISRNVQTRNILTPMVKYIGNMHGDETIGRQLLIYLAQYLLFNYDKNIDIASLVNSTDLYLMPTMNPDGFFRSQVTRVKNR